ncbi:EAL domain-containing protein [Desulfobulbus rhabdoformis]|uniref:EAL domain-containing protein n=1 Tax=Desulfobulbus rhabdoformis TaxID=34032 RepID=UPI001964D86E|nr:EAL domain-containing protein [Desulfobulbus rhabdoformis]MBM9613437.1 EAL domain-containing protein [Desulfobulbus rhabdoformis]
MTIRTRIFTSYTLFLLIPLLAAVGFGGYLSARQARQALEQQAYIAVDSIIQSTRSAANASLAQTLHTSAASSLRVITSLYEKSRSGALSLDEAQWLARESLNAQQNGTTSKLLLIDNQGKILVHPDANRLQSKLNNELQLRLRGAKSGTLIHVLVEGQEPTVYSISTFSPWQWSIIAYSPTKALKHAVPFDELSRTLSHLSAGSLSALPVVVSPQGDMALAVPLTAESTSSAQQLSALGRQITMQQKGTLRWNPNDPLGERILFFSPITELNLVAGVAIPSSQFNGPMSRFIQRGSLTLLPLGLLALAISYLLAQRMSRPLQNLADLLERPDQELSTEGGQNQGSEECGRIISSCSQMLSALNNQQLMLAQEQETNESMHQQLKQEMRIRQEAEHKLENENTTRKSAEKYLLLFKNIFDNAIEGIYITDPEGRILTTNNSFSRVTGYPASEIIGKHPGLLASNQQVENSFKGMWKKLPQTGSWSGEIWSRKKDGSICPQWLSVSVIRNEYHEITHYFAFFHDITELKRKEKQISILAYSDALTKLPNRAALEHRLTKAISRAGREKRALAVFFIDLDNFKNINDSMGHDKGDQVLIEVAERLSATIRSEDTLSRLGGDEFILLSESVDDENAVYNLATRILASLKNPIKLHPNTIYVNASIGIALYPDDGRNSQELIKNADMAMYKAKSEGKNKFVMFTQEMNEKLLNRIRIENSIRSGLKEHEFTVFYQPKINLLTEQPTSFEALVRWRKDSTIVTPDQFIPVAEESGLIDEMSLYVLDEVCIFLTKIQEHNLLRLPISVNMSPRTFNQKNIVETIDTILGAHRINHRLIEFEITETTAMKDVQHSLETMHRFRERGIRFSIDDFGTGYSSLSYLSEMPVSTLKIDKRFISAADTNSRSIVSTITAMSKQMELNVVAEGVETSEQLTWLRQIGCNEVQGYYFSRPMPEQDTLRYMKVFQKTDQEKVLGSPAPAF